MSSQLAGRCFVLVERGARQAILAARIALPHELRKLHCAREHLIAMEARLEEDEHVLRPNPLPLGPPASQRAEERPLVCARGDRRGHTRILSAKERALRDEARPCQRWLTAEAAHRLAASSDAKMSSMSSSDISSMSSLSDRDVAISSDTPVVMMLLARLNVLISPFNGVY
jgi:hypothetical protein